MSVRKLSTYTVEEVAMILASSPAHVRALLREGVLRGGKLGLGNNDQKHWRIQHEDLDVYMREAGLSGLGDPPKRPLPSWIDPKGQAG